MGNITETHNDNYIYHQRGDKMINQTKNELLKLIRLVYKMSLVNSGVGDCGADYNSGCEDSYCSSKYACKLSIEIENQFNSLTTNEPHPTVLNAISSFLPEEE